MACLVVAVWTFAAAIRVVGELPGWGLVCAAMAGGSLGMWLMILVYEDPRSRERPVIRATGERRLELVRRRGKSDEEGDESGGIPPRPRTRPAIRRPG